MDVPVPVEGWIELVVRCWGQFVCEIVHITIEPDLSWPIHQTLTSTRSRPTFERPGTGLCSEYCCSISSSRSTGFTRLARFSVTSSAHRVPVYSINRSIPATAQRLKLLEEHGEPIVPITHPVEFAVEGEDEYLDAMKLKGSREPVE